jgi:lactoylglutathione lyase
LTPEHATDDLSRATGVARGESDLKAKLIYTGIRVKDLDKSIEFYAKVLGMKVTGRTKIEATKGETVGLVSEEGGHLLELNYYGKGSEFDTSYSAGASLDHLAFQVDDLEKALAEAAKAGYPAVLDMKTKTSRWTYIKDPNGIYIELFGK